VGPAPSFSKYPDINVPAALLEFIENPNTYGSLGRFIKLGFPIGELRPGHLLVAVSIELGGTRRVPKMWTDPQWRAQIDRLRTSALDSVAIDATSLELRLSGFTSGHRADDLATLVDEPRAQDVIHFAIVPEIDEDDFMEPIWITATTNLGSIENPGFTGGSCRTGLGYLIDDEDLGGRVQSGASWIQISIELPERTAASPRIASFTCELSSGAVTEFTWV
jgi:hypothetical protein